jgi:hypothetical protein
MVVFSIVYRSKEVDEATIRILRHSYINIHQTDISVHCDPISFQAMSQIIRHLTLFALLLKIHLSSTSPITSPVTSPVTYPVTYNVKSLTDTRIASLSSETFLTGYVTVIRYEGSSCSNQHYANSRILNSCFNVDESTYQIVTATSSSVVQTSYTDSQCTTGARVSTFAYTDGACDTSDSTKVYVSSSSVWNSDFVTATVR